jgi:4,5-DOPA dioxygenase extradiol
MMMEAKRMPAVFVGHGSPMLALEDSVVTRRLGQLGKEILGNYGRPKAILMVSAHWYKNRNLVQRTERPEQVYDMYGFPPELYAVKYEPKGYPALADTLLAIANLGATVDNSWGLDHGAWTLLIHMFPEADIPVVQLSVNSVLTPRQCYDIGRLLAPLRHEGYLLMGSGNVVHNLRMTNWASDHGSPEAETFNDFITDAVVRRDDEAVIQFNTHPLARYAVPTNDHFYPLLYMLGASEGERPQVFNKVCNLDSMAMTGYLFDADNK